MARKKGKKGKGALRQDLIDVDDTLTNEVQRLFALGDLLHMADDEVTQCVAHGVGQMVMDSCERLWKLRDRVGE